MKESEMVDKFRKEFGELETVAILGTGWNKVLEKVEKEKEMDYQELFGMKTSVPGHEGKLVVGKVRGKRVGLMVGRMHLYEGWLAEEATLPIRILGKAGVRRLVVTSASGAINPKYKVGDFVVLSDLLTLFLKDNPLVGAKFQDMSEVFDEEWRTEAILAVAKLGVVAREGVYAYMPGPHFETMADKMALNILGADCVGMSTVPEVLQAKNLGMKVLGLSFITNLALVKHSHEEVLAAAEEKSELMGKVIEVVV